MRNAKLLMFNTLVLTITGFIMRTISVSFNVYLTNKIGAEGIGLFQLIMTVYGLAVTFAGAGVKLGATRLVTDSLNTESSDTGQIVKLCIKYSLCAGLSVCFILFLFAGIIGKIWIGDLKSISSLKLLSFSLPPISVSAALNGYFTAKKTLVKYSIIQLLEQFLKIIITVVLLSIYGNMGTEYASGAICFGITASEIFSAFSAYIIFIKDKNKKNNIKKKSIFSKLLHIAVPDAVGASFRAVLLTAEHLLIPKGFAKAGDSTNESMAVYGTIHGMALPIVLYPSAILSALSSLLIGEMSSCLLFDDKKRAGFISSTSIKLTLIFSIGISGFMVFFSDKLSLAVYNDLNSAFYIRVISFLVPIMYTDMITDGLLKGIDQQNASMRYNIFDSAICVILVYLLLPIYAVKGYIFILFLSEIINFMLSINRLIKFAKVEVNISTEIIKPIICSVISCATVNMVINFFTLSDKAILIISAAFTFFFYSAMIILTDCISNKELKTYRALFGKVALD